MKLTVFIYFITCLQLSAKGIAQTVTLSQHDISLQKLFREIKKQTGYQFFYKDEILANAKKVKQIDVDNASIKEVLDKSFLGQPFSYEIVEKTITIIPKKKETEIIQAPPPQNIIHGRVTDSTGKAIAGASVTIAGAKKGAITNANGEYELAAKQGDAVEISFIGFKSKTIIVGNNDEINIQLSAQVSELTDFVIVGYGKQKKIDLTGAVATVSSKELENRPVTNVSSALAGLIPGAYVYQSKGTPGEDGANIQIRGVGSLSSTSPLVVIDGVIGSLDDINPNDVESISILKDAASVAIYGAQGAAGVILVTTKEGKTGVPTVTYTGLVSSTNPTGIPEFVTNSAQYMQTLNESYTNIGKNIVFDSATVIQPFIDAAKNPNGLTSLGVPNYVAYPNTNWEDVLFQHHLLQSHNISVNGGDKNTHYLLSFGYLNNPGLVASSGYSKYQFRINVDSKIGKNITVGTQTFAKLGYSGLFDEGNLFNYLVQTSPMIYPLYKGMYGSTSADGDVIGQASDLLYYTTSNTGSKPETYINTTWYAKVNIIKGLTFEPKFNYQTDFDEYNYHNDPVATARYNFITLTQVTPATPTTNLSTYSGYSKDWNYTLESALRYNTTIAGVHNIGALLVFNQYYDQSYNLAVTGYGLIDPSISAISSASSFPSRPSGSASDWSTRSLIGRITYNYKDKYLFEANMRRDASSRFGPDYRYGNFPSLSAGWNISKEPFLASLSSHNIQNIKIRASWGRAGNANIGNYRWQANYGTTPYSFNGTAYSGLYLTAISNPALHWETTEQLDAGLDVTAFRNLDFTFDWYRKYTYGILFTAPLDPTVGAASAPEGNFAQVLDNGLEFSAGWHDKIGDFNYSINGNLTYYYYNDVKQYKGPLVAGLTTDGNGNSVYNSNIGAVSSGSSQRILEGHKINEYYLQTVYKGSGNYFKADGSVDPNGGPKTGMIRTPQDMAWVQAMQAAGYSFAPVNTIGKGQLYYGDLLYADNNGDGIYGGSNDQKFMNVSTSAKVGFGLNLSASWKGLGISMIWAGATGKDYLWNQTYYNSVTMALGGTEPSRIVDNHYYYNENNPGDPKNNINGYFPRLKQSDNIDNVASTFWLYNASYVKLKNIQISYTLPQQILGKVKDYITACSLFLSGENLLTITKYPGPDPEIGTAVTYPLMKQYAFGINVKF